MRLRTCPEATLLQFELPNYSGTTSNEPNTDVSSAEGTSGRIGVHDDLSLAQAPLRQCGGCALGGLVGQPTTLGGDSLLKPTASANLVG
jgi:hypothetical protein